MLHQQLQVSFVGVQLLLAVTANVPGQLGRHLIHSPTGEGFFQEHLPAAGVDSLEESQTARVIVARIASGREASSMAALSPRILLRRIAWSANRPSKFKETPFATACNSGPRARSAW